MKAFKIILQRKIYKNIFNTFVNFHIITKTKVFGKLLLDRTRGSIMNQNDIFEETLVYTMCKF